VIDIYCERLGPGLGAEPLNALTNAAFVLAAWLLWRQRPHGVALPWVVSGSILWIAAIGAGSAAWHLWPIPATGLADTLPIALFIVTYVAGFLRQRQGLGLAISWIIGVVLVLAMGPVAFLLPSGFLNGSGPYLVPAAGLIGLAWLRRRTDPALAVSMAGTVGIFGVSLGARSLDAAICPHLPIGTHFLWHVLNAWVLYRLTRDWWRFPPNHGRWASRPGTC
jgi:hypothetical protein